MKMNLSCETILDVYTYKNRNVLCQIRISPKSSNLKNSCRSLSQEDWSSFDKQLKKLIATIDECNNEKCLEFNIKQNIRVSVQKSKLSAKKFYKFLGRNGDFESISGDDPDVADDNFVLECIFDFQKEVPPSFSTESQDYDNALESISDTSLSYEPYTPKKKNFKTNKIYTAITPDIDFLECDEIINPTNSSSERSQIELLLTSAACSSSDSKKSNDNDFAKKTVVQKQKNSSRDDKKSIKNALEEATPKKYSETDYIREVKKRSKSSDVVLENIEKKHSWKKERPKSAETLDLYDIRVNRKHLKTPDQKSHQKKEGITEKILNKDINKTSCEKKDKSYKAEQKKIDKDCSLKEKNTQSEKEPNTSLGEDDITTMSTENQSIKGESTAESATDSSPQKEIKRGRKLKSSSTEITTSLRRSERSPSKPKRFMDEQHKLLLAKKHKSSHNNKELFGTDDDDDHFFENSNSGNKCIKNKIKSPAFETPVSRKTTPGTSSSSSTSTKKKRKRAESSECHQQEKRDMSKWLSKKKLLPLDEEEAQSARSKKKSSSCKPLPLKASTKTKFRKVDGSLEKRAKSATPPPTKLEMPSKEEIQLIKNQNKLMQKENAITKAELNKMCPSSPVAVEILSLQNIHIDEILDTFATYKSELDEIYENNYKRDYIKGHDGINHCFVMRLLQQNTQMKMLEKLTEVYESSNAATQATLFANALLPEWIIRVYMEKFEFTRQKAIEQIKAQEEFQLHMETQNENSFMFD